jgi:hypothetical protein|tara:strand:+ start:1512 stop:2042 length:531 start_codon:yes stop_codon:yes gene_type:complete
MGNFLKRDFFTKTVEVIREVEVPGPTPIFTKTFGGENDDVASSVQQTADGGYIIAGFTTPYFAGNWDAYLVKTDGEGNYISIPRSAEAAKKELEEETTAAIPQIQVSGYSVLSSWPGSSSPSPFSNLKSNESPTHSGVSLSQVTSWGAVNKLFMGSEFSFFRPSQVNFLRPLGNIS